VGIPVFCDGQRFNSVTRLTHRKTISMCKSRRRKVQLSGSASTTKIRKGAIRSLLHISSAIPYQV
jgi:hypothetical protein